MAFNRNTPAIINPVLRSPYNQNDNFIGNPLPITPTFLVTQDNDPITMENGDRMITE